MTSRGGSKSRRPEGLRYLVVAWLVTVPIGWFFLQLTLDVPWRAARATAAGFGWYGERGEVTVTSREKVRTSDGTRLRCYGTFRPADGGPAVERVRIHLDGTCTPGRAVEARLMRKDDDSWLIPMDDHEAFAGSGWGTPLVLLVFMGVFCLVVGGPFILYAAAGPIAIPVMWYRRRTRRPAGRGAREEDGGQSSPASPEEIR